MSTKEGYDGAYSELSNEVLENYVEDICIGIALSDDALAIRKLIARYKSDLAAKDAEIAELKAKYEMQLGAWVRDGQSIGEIASRYIALRSRIEAAPKVWGRYHSENPTQLIEITADTDEMRSWATDCPWSPVRQVHAVPVEEEK